MKLSRILLESIDLRTARYYTSILRTASVQKRLDNFFKQLVSLPGAKKSKRVDRVYVPLGRDVSSSRTYQRIKQALEDEGYKLIDYLKGIAKDDYGRRIKLGKALTKLKLTNLRDHYNTDEIRAASDRVQGYIVFSKHQYDLASMASGRKWTNKSCMDLYRSRVADDYITADIDQGTFIAYYITPDDFNLQDPVGRVLVKPFVSVDNADDIFYSTAASRIYGDPPDGFLEKVDSILENIQNVDFGDYRLIQRVYLDIDSTDRIIKIPKTLSTKHEVEIALKIISEIPLSQLRYEVHDDLSVSIHHSIKISVPANFNTIPVKFKEIHGSFDISHSNLTSLKNAPEMVHGNFDFVSKARKTTLLGGPQYVEGSYHLFVKKMDDLDGAPRYVGKYFSCGNCELKSLEGGPDVVGGLYFCENNKLKTLKGLPKNDFLGINAKDNLLTSLEGLPKEVHNVELSKNHLTSLEGGLKKAYRLDVSDQASGVTFTNYDLIDAGIDVEIFKTY